jgi:hypothetical protein
VAWEQPGARGAGDANPPASRCPPFGIQPGQWIEWDVTEMVRRWIADPSTNLGLKVSQDKAVSASSVEYVTGAYDFYSAQAFRRELRPMLVVRLASEAKRPSAIPPLFD